LAALDETQDTKRKNLVDTEKELSSAKASIQSLKEEDQTLAQKEGSLGSRHKDSIVRLNMTSSCLFSTFPYTNSLSFFKTGTIGGC
jgi:hypothetical protein